MVAENENAQIPNDPATENENAQMPKAPPPLQPLIE